MGRLAYHRLESNPLQCLPNIQHLRIARSWDLDVPKLWPVVEDTDLYAIVYLRNLLADPYYLLHANEHSVVRYADAYEQSFFVVVY